jgi:tetratricopeptide (TPR) repeat protein
MSEEETQRELKRVPLRERSRQWFLTVGTVLALLATTIGFLSDSLGVLEFLQGRDDETPTLIATPTPAATPTLAAENAPSPGELRTLQDTFVPAVTVVPSPLVTTPPAVASTRTPTITPLPVMAGADERLLIVAQFSNFAVNTNFNVAGRIHEALTEQVAAAQLADTRVEVWPESIVDQASAVDLLSRTGATIVIWGEYDSGRVRVRFALQEGGGELEWQRLLGAPTELSTTINLDVPRETQALALTVLGRLYRNAGDLTRARATFAQALAQEPSDQDTIATLTFYLAILDAAATPPNLDRAISGYTAVVELRPNWVNARFNRGVAYLTRYWLGASPQDVEAAIADFAWTIDAKSNYAEAYINRAIAYYARNQSGDLEKMVADLNDAIRYAPTSHRAYYNRGLAYIRLDQRVLWVADLDHALQLAPEYWLANHAFCWGYALDEMPEEAMPHCDIARDHDASGSTLDGRGLALAEMGRLEEAADDLTTYLAWLETQPEAWSSLNNRTVYEEILAGLRAGANPVSAEILARLR